MTTPLSGTTAERRSTMPSWSDRLGRAVKSDQHWNALPALARLDRVFKESGVRDLVVSVCDLEDEVRRLRDALGTVADVLDRGVADDRKLATINRLVNHELRGRA